MSHHTKTIFFFLSWIGSLLLQGHFLGNSKHRVNSIVLIHWDSKFGKPFSNVDLVWKDEFVHTCFEGGNYTCIHPHVHVSEVFARWTRGYANSNWMGHTKKIITRYKKSNDKESPWTYLDGVTTYTFSLIIFAR
jgi:hypothetical protein